MTLDIEEIPIGNYMTAYPISVRKDVSIFDATNFMARHDFGNLIVSDGDDEREDGQPLGIISERDIMREIAKEKTLPDKQVRDIQYTNFEKITPGISVLEAARIMISKKARLLV
ncbi:MAG: CBS domain-containing protein, partial [Nitrosopumilaceae archaeon]|nr:CBS domain-containing protein [Nitrosopumilaceae archaeon]